MLGTTFSAPVSIDKNNIFCYCRAPQLRFIRIEPKILRAVLIEFIIENYVYICWQFHYINLVVSPEKQQVGREQENDEAALHYYLALFIAVDSKIIEYLK